ncbi:MAG: hypothetical protein R2836_04575 [Chitinophagales bacterium]|nr:hypothetical protein [Bacteroidota bacterium]
MMIRFITSILVLGILVSCKSSSNDVKSETTVTAEAVQQETVANTYETLPAEIRGILATETTNIEATMYESGGSFSLGDKQSAVKFVDFLEDKTPSQLSQHQIGHIMFLKDGEELLFLTVFKIGDKAYTKYADAENNKTYYNMLGGQAANMFLNLKLQTK